MILKPSETSDILQRKLEQVDLRAEFEEVGTVLGVGDGVAKVFGLDNVTAGELIEFENGVRGVAMNLEEDQVGVVLLNAADRVKENMTAKRTGHIASIGVGEGLLGRVINTLGEPIDGAGPITGELMYLPLVVTSWHLLAIPTVKTKPKVIHLTLPFTLCPPLTPTR